MRKWKARLSVFLCILFVLPAVFGCIPSTSIEANAATVKLYWVSGMGTTNSTLTVEVGQKFHIGDYALYNDNDIVRCVSSLKKAKYDSWVPSIASCKNGIIKTLKTGKTMLAVNYKDNTIWCTLNVVKKGKLNMAAYKSVDAQAVDLLNAYGKKITTQNQYQVYNKLMKIGADDSNKTDISGFRFKKVNNQIRQTNELVAVHMAKTYELSYIVPDYLRKINPIAYCPVNPFKIAKVNANKDQKQFNFDIKKNITEDQIFAIQASQHYYKQIVASTNTKFPIYVKDMSTGKIYKGTATATLGSKNIAVQMKKLALKKNQTYQLLGSNVQSYTPSLQWTKGKTFKVK